jgi:hypothetical protein
MARRFCVGAFLLVALGSAACGGKSTDPSVTQWLGSTPHFRALGVINGETIDIDISGVDAQDVTRLWCEREYQAPNDSLGNPIYAQGHHTETRSKAPVTTGGAHRILDLEVKMHDLQADAAGKTVTVIPRDDSNPPCVAGSPCRAGVMWLQWVWLNHDDNDSVMYKQAAVSGQLTTGEFTGAVDATGMFIKENTGTVGAFVTGTWSQTDHLSVSFDANCTVNDIDNG